MAEDTYYAWTRIPVSRNEWGQIEKEVQPGEKVSASDLNVSKEEFQELVDIGAVRTDVYEADDYTPPSRVVKEEPEEVAAVKELRLSQPKEAEAAPQQGSKPSSGNISDQLTTQKK